MRHRPGVSRDLGQFRARPRSPVPFDVQLAARVSRPGPVPAQPALSRAHDSAGELSVVDTPDVQMHWRDQMLFEGGAPGRPAILVDGDSAQATSPVQLLLLAAATCSAADVVSILLKQRVDLRSVDVDVWGTRRAEHPRRFTALRFHFTIGGAGADE